MTILFYLLSLPFIWSEIYTVYNKSRLDKNFQNRDIQSTTGIDVFYYLLRLLFFAWVIAGIWSSQYQLFILLTSLNFIKFPIFHFSKKLYAIWDNILPSINIIQMIIILIYRFLL